MKTVTQTERLRIREMEIADYDSLYALDSDPEVMKYISSGEPMYAEAVRGVLDRIIARYLEWKVYGVWAAELKTSGEFIGWFALKPLPGTAEIELGYRLLKKYWDKGYATEGAKGLIKHGIHTLNLKKIVAITNPANQASRKVLSKVGMIYAGEVNYRSLPTAAQTRVSWFEFNVE